MTWTIDAHDHRVPPGLCECGCGGQTAISRVSHAAKGYVKGQPMRFLVGHNGKLKSKLTRRPCSVDGCEFPARTRDLCGTHYGQLLRYGKPGEAFDPADPRPDLRGDPADRLWARVDRRGDNECWPWLDGPNTSGYGLLQYSPARGVRRQALAHRLAYELIVGPIPEGLELDHLCRNRLCVNPAHLEPVTPWINNMRSASSASKNARKTHCLRGHEFTPENTYVWHGPKGDQRRCRACMKARKARNRKAARGDER